MIVQADDCANGGTEILRRRRGHQLFIGDRCVITFELVVGHNGREDDVNGLLCVWHFRGLYVLVGLCHKGVDVFAGKVFVGDFGGIAIGDFGLFATNGDVCLFHSSEIDLMRQPRVAGALRGYRFPLSGISFDDDEPWIVKLP